MAMRFYNAVLAVDCLLILKDKLMINKWQLDHRHSMFMHVFVL